ncbi:MAG: hypothetical protein ABI361_04060 [Nitrososphaera sp.]
MIEPVDAIRVVDAISKNLAELSRAKSNFQKLPDTFWGYYARGHDGKGTFGVIITYSEAAGDVDQLMRMYEQWVEKSKGQVDDSALRGNPGKA